MLKPLEVGINTGPESIVTKATPRKRPLAAMMILYLYS
jgi:hypothetical protein